MSDTPEDILEGLRVAIERDYPGWRVAHYVIAVGLECIVDGEVRNTADVYDPVDQPGYITGGLLNKAYELIEERRTESDSDV